MILKDPHAILIYLSQFSGTFYPPDSVVLIDSWLETIEVQYIPSIRTWLHPYLGKSPYDAKIEKVVSKDVKSLIKDLEGSLKKTLFLCGDFLTIADVSLVSELAPLFQFLIDEPTRKWYKSVVEWITRVFEVSQVKNHLGELKLCEEVAKIPGPTAKNEETKENTQKNFKKKEHKADVVINQEEKERKQKERKEKQEKAAKAKAEELLKKENLEKTDHSEPEKKLEEQETPEEKTS